MWLKPQTITIVLYGFVPTNPSKPKHTLKATWLNSVEPADVDTELQRATDYCKELVRLGNCSNYNVVATTSN